MLVTKGFCCILHSSVGSFSLFFTFRLSSGALTFTKKYGSVSDYGALHNVYFLPHSNINDNQAVIRDETVRILYCAHVGNVQYSR